MNSYQLRFSLSWTSICAHGSPLNASSSVYFCQNGIHDGETYIYIVYTKIYLQRNRSYRMLGFPAILAMEVTFIEGTKSTLSRDMEHRLVCGGTNFSNPPEQIVPICCKEAVYKLRHFARPQIGEVTGTRVGKQTGITWTDSNITIEISFWESYIGKRVFTLWPGEQDW